MPIIKKCPVCNSDFKTYPSVDQETCSFICRAKFAWSRKEYREHMSEAHKGQITWMAGRKHKREAILKMRESKLKTPAPQLRNNGYLYIYAPDHPCQINGRVPEQTLIAEKVLGRYLKDDEVVHHINGVKTDNEKGNLLLCTDSYHRYLHAKINGFGTKIQSKPQRDLTTGRFIPGIEAYEERV